MKTRKTDLLHVKPHLSLKHILIDSIINIITLSQLFKDPSFFINKDPNVHKKLVRATLILVPNKPSLRLSEKAIISVAIKHSVIIE